MATVSIAMHLEWGFRCVIIRHLPQPVDELPVANRDENNFGPVKGHIFKNYPLALLYL